MLPLPLLLPPSLHQHRAASDVLDVLWPGSAGAGIHGAAGPRDQGPQVGGGGGVVPAAVVHALVPGVAEGAELTCMHIYINLSSISLSVMTSVLFQLFIAYCL